MANPLDMIGREIHVDDYVVYYSNIYQVKGVSDINRQGSGPVRILLMDKSKTTKPVTKYSGDMCIVSKDDVLMWLLKR